MANGTNEEGGGFFSQAHLVYQVDEKSGNAAAGGKVRLRDVSLLPLPHHPFWHHLTTTIYLPT